MSNTSTASPEKTVRPRHRAPSRGDESPRPRRGLLSRTVGLGTIRGRLTVILAIPTALLVGGTGFNVAAQAGEARAASATVRTVDLVLSAQGLIHNLQRERGLSNGLLGGAVAFRSPVDRQRVDSDAARSALDATLAQAGSGATARAVRAALGRLDDLGAERGAVDAGRLARSDVLAFYTAAINGLNDACNVEPDAGGSDARLRQGLESLRLLGDAKEATALERGTLNGVFAAGAFTSADYIAFTKVRATKLDALADFARVATPGRLNDLQAAERTPQAVQAASFEDRALTGASGTQLHLDPVTWWNAMTTLVDDLRTVQLGVGDDVRARAKQDEATAQRLLVEYAVAAGLALAAAIALWVSTIRSIIRPLRQLTEEARVTSRQRLPNAITAIQDAEDPHQVVVPGPELTAAPAEFAAVARALHDVQTTATRLAVEQAVMRRNTSESLANLARRNQNLVRRQLGLITALENQETDPDQLADLFELDHLATRMRRTAESLLVLVDEHSPRRWPADIDVADVLRAAFADVEDYRRLVLRRIDEARVRGGVAGEVSHLVAELLENALACSPPDREVEIQARRAEGEYHIAVIDAGIGMAPDKLAEANARLRGERNFLAAPTRELGHFVVGRIAERLGIRVWLHESPLNGLTARITLPAHLLAAPAPAPDLDAAPELPVLVGAASTAQGGPATGAALPGAALTDAPVTGALVTGVPVTRALIPEPAPPPTPAVTKNGLVKRSPRAEQTEADAEGRRPVPPAPTGPAARRSPAEVRSMLNAFRGGAQPPGAVDRTRKAPP